jgi:DNA sulfur modification protein DndC
VQKEIQIMSGKSTKSSSAFAEFGMAQTIELLSEEVRELYTTDDVPWVIGYSGGKDSTAIVQLIWNALLKLPPEQRKKPVHVISTDTLVENPVVAGWVTRSLEVMRVAAISQGLPLTPHRLTPTTQDSFWVNLIGKGYPAPRHKFRWCTERLKIKPSNAFINGIVRESREAILVLGTRKAESSTRSRVMTSHEKRRIRDRLSPNAGLPGTLIYTPVETWTNDDVWLYLMQVKNPWGYNNKDLLGMYQGASPDGECPLVVDSTTPSCGDSRFGCWVCTLVDKDRSMSAMIQNDSEKDWMLPLLELRNALDLKDDKPLRDFRRMNGSVQLMNDGRFIPGPYLQRVREDWLRRLLKAQTHIRKHGPADVRKIELVTLEELQEIRRIWVVDKHEFEDTLPRIYHESTGEDYPGPALDDSQPLGADDLAVLNEQCGGDLHHYEMVRDLLDVERSHRMQLRRAGLFDSLEGTIRRHFFEGEEDAVQRTVTANEAYAKAGKGDVSAGAGLATGKNRKQGGR